MSAPVRPVAAKRSLSTAFERQWHKMLRSPGPIVALAAVMLAAALLLMLKTRVPTDAQLTVYSTPAGADVYLDGTLQPVKTSATIRGLKPNVGYMLRVAKAGHGEISKVVTIPESTRSLVVEVRLQGAN